MEGLALTHLFEDTQLFLVKEGKNEKTVFEGENKQRTLILCNTGKDNIAPDKISLLHKILGSIKLDLNDVALINSDNVPMFHHLKSKIEFRKMILFGVTPLEIGLNISYSNYFPVTFQSTDLLVCESLAVLNDNSSSKTQLWNALKKMFAENV